MKETEEETGKPSWILDEENCFYCNKPSGIDCVEFSENKDGVVVRYKCKDKECKSPLSGGYSFGFIYDGSYYVEQYQEFIEST